MSWEEVIEALTEHEVPFEIRRDMQLGDSVQIGWGELSVEFEDPDPAEGARRMNGVDTELPSARLAGVDPCAWTIEQAAEQLGGAIDREHEANGLVWVRMEYPDTSSAGLIFVSEQLQTLYASPRYDEAADAWIWPEPD